MEKAFSSWLWQDYSSLGSTNDLAKETNLKTPFEKRLITAQTQTAGRGRRGRNWVSERGNLFMSLLFTPTLEVWKLAFVASLSVAKTLLTFEKTLDVRLKWPNDVLIGGKKVCGMLIEAGQNGAFVVGIGLNLVSSPDPATMIYPVTNLKDEGLSLSREHFLKHYLKVFEDTLALCEKDGFEPIRRSWLSLAYRLNQEITVKQGSTTQTGLFEGIDQNGFLILRQQDSTKKISVGDVIEQGKDK